MGFNLPAMNFSKLDWSGAADVVILARRGGTRSSNIANL
jgi:hypothetical protein